MTRVEFDIPESELARFNVFLRASGEQSKEDLRDAAETAARAAQVVMQAEVPRDTGALASGIELRFNGLVYRPGGAGGGGYYEAVISIDASRVPHVRYVYEGTGRFGPSGGNITPSQGSVMAFAKKGEGMVFTRHTSGQKPQTDWVEHAAETAERYIEAFVASY